MINFSEVVKGLKTDEDLLKFARSVKASYPEDFDKAEADPEVERLKRMVDSLSDKSPLKKEVKAKLGVKLAHQSKYNNVFYSDGLWQAKIYNMKGELLTVGGRHKDKEEAAFEAKILKDKYRKQIKLYRLQQEKEKALQKAKETERKKTKAELLEEQKKDLAQNLIKFDDNPHGVKSLYKGWWVIDYQAVTLPKGYKPNLEDKRVVTGSKGNLRRIEFYHNGVRHYTSLTAYKKAKVYYALEFIDKYLEELQNASTEQLTEVATSD